MICCTSEQQAAVAAVIFEEMSHLELSTSGWSMVEQLKDTVKPFEVATQALSTDAHSINCPAIISQQTHETHKSAILK